MNIYIDDERAAPEGFVLVKSTREFFELLFSMSDEEVESSTFDFDYWMEQSFSGRRTGLDAIMALYERTLDTDIDREKIEVLFHSSDRFMNEKMSERWIMLKKPFIIESEQETQSSSIMSRLRRKKRK